MSYSKLIHEYIDSGLPSDSEFALFDELAKSSELRGEFNRQMKIHTLARQEMESITPPAQVTQSLFSSLGFDFPPKEEEPAEPIITPAQQSWYSKLKKYTPMVMIALLSSGVTSLFFMSYNGNKLSSDSYNLSSKTHNAKSANLTSIPKALVPTSASTEETSSRSNSLASGSNKYISARNNNSKHNQSAYSANTNGALANDDDLANETVNTLNTANQNGSATENDLLAANSRTSNFMTINPVSNKSISEQARREMQEKLNSARMGAAIAPVSDFAMFGQNSFMNPNAFVNPDYILSFNKINGKSTNENPNLVNNNSIPENVEFVGLYKVGEGSYLGVHLARESFGQQFNVTKNGLSVVQNQTPVINWVGATYRFMPQIDLLSDKASVYAQATAGGSSIGPVGKTSLGAIINIIYGINLNISAEYGILLYNVDGKIYNSNRFGINYGLAYTF